MLLTKVMRLIKMILTKVGCWWCVMLSEVTGCWYVLLTEVGCGLDGVLGHASVDSWSILLAKISFAYEFVLLTEVSCGYSFTARDIIWISLLLLYFNIIHHFLKIELVLFYWLWLFFNNFMLWTNFLHPWLTVRSINLI